MVLFTIIPLIPKIISIKCIFLPPLLPTFYLNVAASSGGRKIFLKALLGEDIFQQTGPPYSVAVLRPSVLIVIMRLSILINLKREKAQKVTVQIINFQFFMEYFFLRLKRVIDVEWTVYISKSLRLTSLKYFTKMWSISYLYEVFQMGWDSNLWGFFKHVLKSK